MLIQIKLCLRGFHRHYDLRDLNINTEITETQLYCSFLTQTDTHTHTLQGSHKRLGCYETFKKKKKTGTSSYSLIINLSTDRCREAHHSTHLPVINYTDLECFTAYFFQKILYFTITVKYCCFWIAKK